MIVGLMGMSRVGKDTAAHPFIENGFKRLAFGDAVKKHYSELTGISIEEINGVNKDKIRPEIIRLAESKRDINPFYWVDVIKSEIIRAQDAKENVILTDMRRIPEVKFLDALREVYGEDQVFLYEVIKPESNGGKFDLDAQTALGINYAHFNRSVNGIIYNLSTIEKLYAVSTEIMGEIMGGVPCI